MLRLTVEQIESELEYRIERLIAGVLEHDLEMEFAMYSTKNMPSTMVR